MLANLIQYYAAQRERTAQRDTAAATYDKWAQQYPNTPSGVATGYSLPPGMPGAGMPLYVPTPNTDPNRAAELSMMLARAGVDAPYANPYVEAERTRYNAAEAQRQQATEDVRRTNAVALEQQRATTAARQAMLNSMYMATNSPFRMTSAALTPEGLDAAATSYSAGQPLPPTMLEARPDREQWSSPAWFTTPSGQIVAASMDTKAGKIVASATEIPKGSLKTGQQSVRGGGGKGGIKFSDQKSYERGKEELDTIDRLMTSGAIDSKQIPSYAKRRAQLAGEISAYEKKYMGGSGPWGK